MAIDPTAPVTPISPLSPARSAADSAAAASALARAALANSAATLSEIAGNPQADSSGPIRHPTPKTSATGGAAPAVGQPVVDQPASLEFSIADRLGAALRSAGARAAPVQSGLAPMMADLEAAIARPETPPPVRQAARAVLESAIPTDRPVTPATLRAAVQGSGVFLEAHLARAATPAPQGLPPSSIQPSPNDMKAALLVFRSVVSTWLAKAPATAPNVPQASPKGDAATAKAASSPISTAHTGYTQTGATSPASPRLDAPLDPPEPHATEADVEAGRKPLPGNPPARDIGGRMPPPTSSASTPSRAEPGVVVEGGEALVGRPDTESEPNQHSATPPTVAPRAGSVPTAAPARAFLNVGLIEDDVVELPPSPESDDQAVLRDPRAVASQVRSQSPGRPPPPYAGGPTTAQAAGGADLPEGMPPADLARRLLKGADGAIARQELLQIASLPEPRGEGERLIDTKTASRWVFDLPFQTPQGVAVAQFEISRDGGGGGADSGREIERTWRARFSLDVEPLGPVHVQIALTGAVTRVGLWTERPDAMARLQAGEAALSAALRAAELSPEVAFHAGAPTVALTAPGRFVDRAS